ncbi:MAG: CoA transferase [Deltaproteobacteria bacterium]|nr:CoA transferase [Deltaproteobacteria bacterium]
MDESGSGLETFETLLRSLGVRAPEPGQVRIDGADPVLATRFRVGEAAAAALAACALQAARIFETRGGRRQTVRVDVVGAAASLLGFLFQRAENPAGLPAYDPARAVTGIYPTRDGGHFLLHGSFPESQARALAWLGCDADVAEVARRIASWDGQALEDALAERGLCGARVRSAAEWREHAQGRALAALPVVEVIKLADGPPEPFAPGARPLSGVRVLDLTRVLAGPTCGRTLASHGADVLRIGSPKLPSIAPFVIDTSHGKRSAHLDLDLPGDVERLRELSREADVFAQGYRSGALSRRGFGPEALCELRPGIVYTSINCYGHQGPWALRPGWEQLAQAVTGIALEHGGASGPSLLPAAATDYNTGYLAALGTMIALSRRSTEGGSYHVRASLCQTGMWLERMRRSDSAGAGLSPERIAPFLVRSETSYGQPQHLGPIVEMSETPARWELPTPPLGAHPPRFGAGQRRSES